MSVLVSARALECAVTGNGDECADGYRARDVESYTRTAAEPAPVPTFKLDMLGEVFIVTVAPSAIVTLSLAVGTTPPTHVVVRSNFRR